MKKLWRFRGNGTRGLRIEPAPENRPPSPYAAPIGAGLPAAVGTSGERAGGVLREQFGIHTHSLAGLDVPSGGRRNLASGAAAAGGASPRSRASTPRRSAAGGSCCRSCASPWSGASPRSRVSISGGRFVLQALHVATVRGVDRRRPSRKRLTIRPAEPGFRRGGSSGRVTTVRSVTTVRGVDQRRAVRPAHRPVA